MADDIKYFLLNKERKIDRAEVFKSIETAFKNDNRIEAITYVGYITALKHYSEGSAYTKALVEERMKCSNYSANFYYGYLRAMYDKGSINLNEYKALIPYTKREMEGIL